MAERQNNRDAVERLARRVKEHNDQRGGAMRSSLAAKQEAASVARRRDAEKAAGEGKNPNRSRKQARRDSYETESRLRRAGAKPGRTFVDLGKKG